MSDLSHDAVDDGFHEIHLSGKQLVFLFMVLSCVSVVIFLCGVFVGRGVRAARGEDAVEIAAAQPQQPTVSVATPAQAAEPPAPPPETPDELSYHKRLQGGAPAAETLKKPAEPPPVAPEAAAPRTSAPAPAPAAAQPPPPQPKPHAATGIPSEGKPGKWFVQVLATKDATVAERLATRLSGKGLPAFLSPPVAGEVQPYYRVRVGNYDDKAEAEAVRARIAKEEQFKPFIQSR